MYVGRFAPTPSGPMHLGSLMAAIASYLDAKANRGRWLLRIDDIDTPRVEESAEQSFYDTLIAHGLRWDEPVSRQSDHLDAHQDALSQIKGQRCVFYCSCSRSVLRGVPIYPGFCRDVEHPPNEPHSIRIQTGNEMFSFTDRIQGRLTNHLANVDGDFVICRKDNIPAYPLAVVVDDAITGVTHVVRGSDLIDNTFNQLLIAQKLNLSTPTYAHIPVLNERNEIKLSKRHSIVAIDNRFPTQNLLSAMSLLGLEPPPLNDVHKILNWGVHAWEISKIPKQRSIRNFMSI